MKPQRTPAHPYFPDCDSLLRWCSLPWNAAVETTDLNPIEQQQDMTDPSHFRQVQTIYHHGLARRRVPPTYIYRRELPATKYVGFLGHNNKRLVNIILALFRAALGSGAHLLGV